VDLTDKPPPFGVLRSIRMTKFNRTAGATPRPYNDEGPGVLPGPSGAGSGASELYLPAPYLLRPEGLAFDGMPGRHGIAHTGDARLLVGEEGLCPHDALTIHHDGAEVNTQFQRYRLRARARASPRATARVGGAHHAQEDGEADDGAGREPHGEPKGEASARPQEPLQGADVTFVASGTVGAGNEGSGMPIGSVTVPQMMVPVVWSYTPTQPATPSW